MRKTNANNYVILLFVAALAASCLPAFLVKGIHPRVVLNAAFHITAAYGAWMLRGRLSAMNLKIENKRSLETATWVTLLAAAGAHYVLDCVLTGFVFQMAAGLLMAMPENVLRVLMFASLVTAVCTAGRAFLKADAMEKRLKAALPA